MAVTHPATMRNLIADTVVDTLDGGSSNAEIHFTTASTAALVCILTYNTTAYGAAAAGVATANSITDGVASTAGTVTIAIHQTSTDDQKEAFRCGVGSTGSGQDIELSSNIISSGQTISLTSLTYTAPS